MSATLTLPACGLSLGVLRAQVQAIRTKAPTARVFGIASPQRWTGPAIDGAPGNRLAVFQCDSPLQMRLALQQAEAGMDADFAVLLTPLNPADLSEDILLRLALRRLHTINNWEIVRALFKATSLDPRLTRHAALAEFLLEEAGDTGFKPVSGGMVDAETAWGVLLSRRFGLNGDHPDLASILRATAESDLAKHWRGAPTELRTAAAEWLAQVTGDAVTPLLTFLGGANGHLALAAGLVMEVVFHDAAGPELDKAVGRFEAWLGLDNPAPEPLRRWRDAAADVLRQLKNPTLRRVLDDAEALLRQVGAAEHAWRSTELESAFEQRLGRFAAALTAQVESRATAIGTELQPLFGAVRRHRLGRTSDRRLARLQMAMRLARWLADRNAAAAAPGATGLAEMAAAYAREGSLVDWARQVLRGGEPNPELSAAYACLVDRVSDLREKENAAFGRALAARQAQGDPASGLIPVEQLLAQVAAPLAVAAPVLVLVIDGMNWAVCRELLSDITTRRWKPLRLEALPQRLQGLAALPSVTEVCRTSLFCGELRAGQAADEATGFAQHPALRAASKGVEPCLFHKAALEGGADPSLAAGIRQALGDPRQRVVGIVINAVDDFLDHGEQMDAVWSEQQIRVLGPILAEAAAAGRAVLLTADHGHILERQTQGRQAADGLRWRTADGAPADDEVEIRSARIAGAAGGRVIVPISERLRYGTRKNGYHGGATPQEMLVPVAILWPESSLPDGLSEMPADLPLWWAEPTELPLPQAQNAPAAKSAGKARRAAAAAVPALPGMEGLVPAATIPKPAGSWIQDLLRSQVYAAQKALASRAAVPDEVVAKLLEALDSRGGSLLAPALATALNLPEHRLSGLLAQVRRLLNVEGYAVLERQEATNTVGLNVALLKRQFGIESK